jgi:hypothetical protein
MIRYLKHKEIDFAKWDTCILESPNGMVYALSWYLDIVAGEWNAYVEDDYESVFPAFPKRKYGILYSMQPLWTQQLGLFSTKLIHTDKTMVYLGLMRNKYKWFFTQLNSCQNLDERNNYQIKNNNNFVLELIHEYEHLYSNFSENHKRNIKKNINRLTVSTLASHEEIIQIFRENRGKSIQVLNDRAYSVLNRLVYHARRNQIAQVYGVYDETNTLLGGAIFFKLKERSIMIFSAVSDIGKSMSAMHVLINRYIENHANQNLLLDFEGSNDENLARFYMGFGAKNRPYYSIINNRTILPDGLINFLRKKL